MKAAQRNWKWLILGFLALGRPCLAQVDSSFLFKADAAMEAYTQSHPVERIYLHLDNQNYRASDTVWFKAYTVVGYKHQLSALSGVLYVELINKTDSVVQRQILPLTAGVTWGGIPLSIAYTPGIYRIRAYTKWMQNQGEESFFNADIQIGGALPTSNNSITQKQTPNVQFMPEGGNLVAGLRSRVGIKAINANGLGEDVSGVVIDNDGKVVADFATAYLGMGVFALMPENGKTYRAKITAKDLPQYVIDLPAVQPKGFVLSVVDKPGSLQVMIAANNALLIEQKSALFYLVAQTNGKIYFTTAGALKAEKVSASVDKARFPSGITRFTLFSGEGLPLCERIVFIRNPDTLRIDVKPLSSITGLSQKIKVGIRTKSGLDNVTMGSYSVAITNNAYSAINETAENSILSNLLLTAELRGNIENANSYFLSTNAKSTTNLDLLMLTQGYHKFNWEKAFSPESETVSYLPEKALQLTGTVKTKAGLPVANGNINLVAAAENFTADTTTNADGYFAFNNLALSDTVKLVLQAKTAKNNRNVVIEVNKPVYAAINSTNLPTTEQRLTTSQSALMTDNFNDYKTLTKQDSISKTHQLKEVIIRDKKPFTPKLEYSSNILGPSHADQVISGEALEGKGCINLKDCLLNRMNGVIIQGKAFYAVRALARINPTPMVVIIDGVQVPLESLEDISAVNVYAVEVLRSGGNLAIYGSNAAGGAIVVTMKKGFTQEQLARNKIIPQGLITLLFKGYDKMREFYQPAFEPSAALTGVNKKATIYWKPNIISDEKGNASFEFLSPGAAGNYRLVIEGIDDEGHLGRSVYSYKIATEN
nr:carboxypeptidase regulatory-like domain-containing protein [uncultured Mucilaginibacter sp.]